MQDVISRNAHPAQSEQHPSFGAKLQDHVRTDVGSPDVVFSIDANHVRRHEQVVRNAAEEFAGRVELHERMLSTMKNVDVPLRIHRDARRFDQMLSRWQLEEIRNHLVVQFRQ